MFVEARHFSCSWIERGDLQKGKLGLAKVVGSIYLMTTKPRRRVVSISFKTSEFETNLTESERSRGAGMRVT
uniref:Uncharacterized protein n=1 Tax=Nelumbo nucifera TaxID=4432 RepID=A0A822Y6K2_NELNU|nr:TPA_asm: hypothetical protein HUJ06_026692 [Nelumbo nucifera]